MASLFKTKARDGKKSAAWYGKVKADGQWRKVRLFTDKTASTRRLSDLQREADQRAAGVVTVEMGHAATPVKRHAADYLAALQLSGVKPDHHAITTNLLNRLVADAGWAALADITADSLRAFVTRLLAGGLTVSYGNKFINVAKAFVHWMLRERRIGADPLAGVKRGNEKRAKKRRARRPLHEHELVALLAAEVADTGRNLHARRSLVERRLPYALAAYAGLRRAELADLRWGDLRLHAPVPFVQLREEQTKNGKADALPLHPYLLGLLRSADPGDEDAPVVATVPDIKTLKKDLARVGIDFADAKGRRADFHAFRHTLATNLSAAGCSETNKRAMMRHADESVTDGYSHARLAELADVLARIPSPPDAPGAADQRAVRTGTDGPFGPAGRADHIADQSGPNSGPNGGPRLALTGGDGRAEGFRDGGGPNAQVAYTGGLRQPPASSDPDNAPKSLHRKELRPDTQAD